MTIKKYFKHLLVYNIAGKILISVKRAMSMNPFFYFIVAFTVYLKILWRFL